MVVVASAEVREAAVVAGEVREAAVVAGEAGEAEEAGEAAVVEGGGMEDVRQDTSLSQMRNYPVMHRTVDHSPLRRRRCA